MSGRIGRSRIFSNDVIIDLSSIKRKQQRKFLVANSEIVLEKLLLDCQIKWAAIHLLIITNIISSLT